MYFYGFVSFYFLGFNPIIFVNKSDNFKSENLKITIIRFNGINFKVPILSFNRRSLFNKRLISPVNCINRFIQNAITKA